MRRAILALTVLAAACHPEQAGPGVTSRVEGTLPTGVPVDAYLFLYPPHQGPPGRPAVPLYVTAVSGPRLASGDGHFVFPSVAPGAYRLSGIEDHDGNLRADVDVLAQPTAGDHLLTGIELEVDGGTTTAASPAVEPALRHDPPAFRLSTSGPELTVPDQPLQLVSFTVLPTDAGVLPGTHAGFAVSLVDADGDGQADDLNADGLPDLWPQAFLRFAPRPGQTVPHDDAGVAGEVVVPLLPNPGPLLTALGGNTAAEVSVGSLQLFLVPQAQAVFPASDGGLASSPLSAIPVGSYELWLLEKTGQFWRVPNALGARGAALFGGDFSAQAVRLTVVHGS